MRERRRYWLLPRRYGRITPARAGKTHSIFSPASSSRDHPRSCGKDPIKHKGKRLLTGSPPLVRERLPDSTPDNTDDRITPARAGKTILIHRSYLPHQDHPRSCGKDATSHSRNPLLGESPPLVRERLSYIGKD